MDLAYLDIGSGSQIAMAIVAGFAGVMVVLKVWWRRVLGLFRRKPAEARMPVDARTDARTEAGTPAPAKADAPVGTDRDQ
jgi:hypothetical protein